VLQLLLQEGLQLWVLWRATRGEQLRLGSKGLLGLFLLLRLGLGGGQGLVVVSFRHYILYKNPKIIIHFDEK